MMNEDREEERQSVSQPSSAAHSGQHPRRIVGNRRGDAGRETPAEVVPSARFDGLPAEKVSGGTQERVSRPAPDEVASREPRDAGEEELATRNSLLATRGEHKVR